VRLEVFGTEDSIVVGLDERTPIRSVEPGIPPPADPYREWVPRFGHTYDAEMIAFLALAEGRGPNHCTVHDGRTALVLAEACMLSAVEGRTVDPREVA
jgi:myo-inositol 2-dehydrogenase/D-chiro-inositol 1-dehydrogenase